MLTLKNIFIKLLLLYHKVLSLPSVRLFKDIKLSLLIIILFIFSLIYYYYFINYLVYIVKYFWNNY